jgi:hypothetical protein
VNNLPLPYHDELLFSVLARAKVHLSISSPKQLLNSLYGHSGIIASMRFGSNLTVLANSFDRTEISSQSLIYKNTLWPLIAPFITPERKLRCELLLMGQRDKSVTVTSGIAASRVKYPKKLRYCSLCLRDQINNLGEGYWQRLHQTPGIDICIEHKCCLSVYSSNNLSRHQHEFFPLISKLDTTVEPAAIHQNFVELSEYVVSLLNLKVLKNPTYVQWSAYYRSLAVSNGLNRGKHIKHNVIESLIANHFSSSWLNSIGLKVDDNDTNWTRTIFRKHRKSFSFLEHYLINRSLGNCKWNVEQTLNEVSKYNKVRCIKLKQLVVSHPESTFEQYRQKWYHLVALEGIKKARIVNGAAYAWLYRHDRTWLLSINADYRIKLIANSHKVNWHRRDYHYARLILRVINETEIDLSHPQRTKTWILTHFDNKSSLEKWLPKLPITSKVLHKYAETTPEYQIRRITRSLSNHDNKKVRPLWFLMRESGLSKERISPLTRQFIKMLLESSIVYGSLTSIEENQQNAE